MKDHPFSQWFTKFSEADELLNLQQPVSRSEWIVCFLLGWLTLLNYLVVFVIFVTAVIVVVAHIHSICWLTNLEIISIQTYKCFYDV